MDKKERKEKVAKKDKKRSAPAVVQDEIKLHDVNPMPQVNMAMPNAETSVPAGSIITPAVNAKKPNAIDTPLWPINNLEKAAKAAEAAKYKTTLDINDYDAVKLRDINPLPTVNVAMPNTETSVGKSIAVPAMTNGERPAEALEQAVKSNAVQSQTAGIIPQKKSISPFSDMLAPQRNKAKQDKTDAVKMQKYYALTDALKSLGHMGGAAVGGAIGGNALDSAPKVAEYQQSRGYIDAFEKAKNANDRLRELDDYEFKLNLSKQQRDEERAYNEKIAQLDRQYRKDMMLLEHELRKAEKAEDRAAEEALRLKIIDLNQKHEEKIKQMSVDMVRMQMEGGDKKNRNQEDTVPFTFQNLTKVDIPKNLYPELISWASSLGQVGDEIVEAENAEAFLRKNPELVNSFLNLYGYGNMPQTPSVETGAQTESNAEPEKKSNPNRTFEEVNAEGIKARKQRKEHRKNNSSYQPLVFGASPSASKDIINLFSSQKEGVQTGSNMSTEDFENKWANK